MKKFSFFLIFLLLLSGGILAIHFLKPLPEPKVNPIPKSLPPPVAKIPPPLSPPREPPNPTPNLPPDWKGEPPARIAIIIDDLGFNAESTQLVLSLKIPLTVSILPFYPYSKKSVEWAHQAGKEVLLHIPMEPVSNPAEARPGKGVLIYGSSRAEIERQVGEDLTELPSVSGASSHMGSLFTTDSEGMRVVFRTLKKRGLFFVDNLTTNKSVTKKIASEEGLKYFLRNVFIDDDLKRGSILQQLEKAEKIAREKGLAIAVGHPHPETISALRDWIPEAQAGGITFVRISELLDKEK